MGNENAQPTGDGLTLKVGFKKDGTPQKRANQFTKRKELNGSVPPKDIVEHRAHIAAARLEAHMLGRAEMSQSEVQAAKALMDKGIASRQAVETVVIEPAAAMTKDEETALLRALISQNPDLVQKILGELARSAGQEQVRAA